MIPHYKEQTVQAQRACSFLDLLQVIWMHHDANLCHWCASTSGILFLLHWHSGLSAPLHSIVLHVNDVSGNRFSRGTRFILGTFCHVHVGRTKERHFGLDILLVLSNQQCVAQGLAMNLTAKSFQ